MAYELGQTVSVEISRERGGFVVTCINGVIMKLGESKVTVQFKDGKSKQFAYSKISPAQKR